MKKFAIYCTTRNHEIVCYNIRKRIGTDNCDVFVRSNMQKLEEDWFALLDGEHSKNINNIHLQGYSVLILDELFENISKGIEKEVRKFDRYDVIIHNGKKSHKINLYPFMLMESLVWTRLVRESSNLIVVSPLVRDYLNKIYDKPCFCIPFKLLGQSSAGGNGIIIPGSLNKKKNIKEYKRFIDLIRSENRDIKISIAGHVAQSSLRKYFDFNNVEYFDRRLTNSEYDKILASASQIAGFPKRFNRKGLLYEVYGKTKDSGIFFDALYFNKPLLTSAFIPDIYKGIATNNLLDMGFKPSVTTYSMIERMALKKFDEVYLHY